MQLLYLCLLIRGPRALMKTMQSNYERAFNLFKSVSYNVSDRLPVADHYFNILRFCWLIT